MTLKTCVNPEGRFRYGIHKPNYQVHNLREGDDIAPLGKFRDNTTCNNQKNFPAGLIDVIDADWIYEVPNPFPFRGTTYITKSWADSRANNISDIKLPESPEVSMTDVLNKFKPDKTIQGIEEMFCLLPQPLLLSLAANSTDPADLTMLAKMSCELLFNQDNQPTGLVYQKGVNGRVKASIKDHSLFEIIVNNPSLPDQYKEVMVLKPGVQGTSEIIGDYQDNDSHIFEYLRSNSYIPWGHYAANMAHDAIRYKISDLKTVDIIGLRHLYYQRTYTRLAQELCLNLPKQCRKISESDLEKLRIGIIEKLANKNSLKKLKFDSTLWGWNFGFDCAASKYRLHASHQMVHQQYAMLPAQVDINYQEKKLDNSSPNSFQSFGCGDLVSDFICRYKEENCSDFFDDYLTSIRNNRRMDDHHNRSSSLIIFEDDAVILFVPKAQTSQWELQLMTTKQVGNILEADTATRSSLNKAMLVAMQTLTGLGAKMITTIEFPKRFSSVDNSQRLLYSFLPKLPKSPGAFSEAQLRWINGHYPEDFAEACRRFVALHVTNK